jgi:hypothetical protein
MDPLFRRNQFGSSGGTMILGIKVPPPKNLGQWLEIATYDLVAPAKERIRTEIEAHYAEAVADHMAHEGVSKADAETAALAELGDAPAAAKKFRKQYLTESEVSGNERLIKMFRRWIFPLGWSFFFFFSLFAHLFRKKESIPILIFQFIVYVALPTILFILARRQNVKSNAGRLRVLWQFVPMGIWINLILSHLSHPAESGFVLTIDAILIFNSLFSLCCACMGWKHQCQKWKQTWPELPPQNAGLS